MSNTDIHARMNAHADKIVQLQGIFQKLNPQGQKALKRSFTKAIHSLEQDLVGAIEDVECADSDKETAMAEAKETLLRTMIEVAKETGLAME